MYHSDRVQSTRKNMEQSDIREVVNLLECAIKSECWDNVDEAILYLRDYLDDDDYPNGIMEE
jgi:hypothetical protein